MTKYTLILLFGLFQTPLFSIDSLLLNQKLTELATAKDTQRLRLLNELSWSLRASDNKKAFDFASEGKDLALDLGDSLQYYSLISNLGIIYALQSRYDQSIESLTRAVAYFERNQNEQQKTKTSLRLGAVLTYFGNYGKADTIFSKTAPLIERQNDEVELMNFFLDYGINSLYWKKYNQAKNQFRKALEISRKLEDTLTASKLLNNIGMAEMEQNNYPGAVKNYFEASKIHPHEDLFKAKIYNNLGNLYSEMENWDKALDFHFKSLEIKEKLGLKKHIANSLNNIGTAYHKKLNFGDALKYLNKSLELKLTLDGKGNDLGETYNNIGTVHLDMNNLKEAEAHFAKYLQLSREINNEFGVCRALNNLADAYRIQEDYTKAIETAKQSLEIAERINFPKIVELSFKIISKSYEALGDFKSAFIFKEKYLAVRDSILSNETVMKIAELERRYLDSRQENELNLEKEKVRQLESQKEIDQLKIGLTVAGLIVLGLFLGIIIFRFRKTKKQAEETQKLLDLEVQNVNLEKQVLKEQILKQQTQLDDYLKKLLDKTELLLNLKEELNQLPEKEKLTVTGLNTVLNQNLQTEKDWAQFEYYFTMVHKDFFKNLKSRFPNLTTYDLNLCALIKLNLNNKEIAQILGISPLSVKKARQRLYQKMDIENNEALVNYIIQI